MQLTVLFFARAREIVGAASHTYDVQHQQQSSTSQQHQNAISKPFNDDDASANDGAVTIDELLQTLTQHHPDLSELLSQCMLSVNLEYINIHTAEVLAMPLNSDDEIALIPPISGG